jgi:hypothetical protein
MIFRQGPAMVVLMVVIYLIYYFGDYAMREGIPMHLSAIERGYEKIQTNYDKQYERVVASFEKAQGQQKETVDRVLNSLEREREVTLQNQKLLQFAVEKLASDEDRARVRGLMPSQQASEPVEQKIPKK